MIVAKPKRESKRSVILCYYVMPWSVVVWLFAWVPFDDGIARWLMLGFAIVWVFLAFRCMGTGRRALSELQEGKPWEPDVKEKILAMVWRKD